MSPTEATAEQKKAKREALELAMLQQLRATKLIDGMEQQYRFAAPLRRWAFDFAWPGHLVALEVEGGLFVAGGGRHNRGAGARSDMEKYNAATLAGWGVLRVSGDHIKDGRALQWVYWLLSRSQTLENNVTTNKRTAA